MNVKVVIDERRSNEDGKYPIKIRFSKGNKTSYYSTGIYAFSDEFDSKNSLLITSDKKKKSIFTKHNSTISYYLSIIADVETDLKKRGKGNINPSPFKSIFLKNLNQGYNNEITFNSYFREFISRKDGRTKDIYQATLDKIEKYFKKQLYFEDINYSWLESFENKMKNEIVKSKHEEIKTGLTTNTRAIHFRNIRAIFNNAIDNEIIGLELYPFRRFKIKNEPTKKRSLTVEQLRLFIKFDCDYHQQRYKDIFMLIFYLIGINLVDLLNLKNINNGYIEYYRSKTHKPYSIKIEPEALDIIVKYKGDNYLLNILDKYSNYKNFTSKINAELKKIGTTVIGENDEKVFTPLFPNLTTYYARHTWATIAASLDIPKETIAAALGHGGNTVTDIYINFDQKKIDEANRKVIDYLFEKK